MVEEAREVLASIYRGSELLTMNAQNTTSENITLGKMVEDAFSKYILGRWSQETRIRRRQASRLIVSGGIFSFLARKPPSQRAETRLLRTSIHIKMDSCPCLLESEKSCRLQ